VLSQALGLKLRYRDGSGRVIAVLIQVDIATGTETYTATFDSEGFTRSNAFQVNGPGLGTGRNVHHHAKGGTHPWLSLTIATFSQPCMKTV
jgi:hypothetical protein